MALVTCPCAFRLRRLAQNRCRGISVWHFPFKFRIKWLVTLGLSDCSRWGAVLIRDGSRNPLISLGLPDRSRCGAVLILMVKEIVCRDLGEEVS